MGASARDDISFRRRRQLDTFIFLLFNVVRQLFRLSSLNKILEIFPWLLIDKPEIMYFVQGPIILLTA
jgi:hypothetical protein